MAAAARRESLDRTIERRRRESDDDGGRFVDLQLDLTDGEDGGVIVGAGGRWDRRRRRFAGSARRGRKIGLHPGQRKPAQWFARWLRSWFAHRFEGAALATAERIYTLILAGGQRSGKTYEGVTFAVLYALMIPGSIVWIVCPTENDFEEVEDLLQSLMPKDWYTRLGWPHWRYSIANGAKIVLRSGHKPEGLKKGDCDLLVINEAQQQKQRVFAIARLRIAKSGALVILCANPPDDPKGQWVAELVAKAERKKIQAVYFHVDPFDNPYIDHGPLLAFAAEVDQRTVDIEVRGLFLGAKNAVFYDWLRLGDDANEQHRPPDALDVTREWLRQREGFPMARVIGIDCQVDPMCAVEFRWFSNPLCPRGHAEWWRWQFMWATREWVIRNADEEDLAIAMIDDGVDPEDTVLVVDASGKWQRVKQRDPQGRPVPEEKRYQTGRGSWDVFHDQGFKRIVNPDKKSEANPDIIERFRATNARICLARPSRYGQRFLRADPDCIETIAAVRGYPNRPNGLPDRAHPLAHLSDAFSYPVNRYYPRRRLRSVYEVQMGAVG